MEWISTKDKTREPETGKTYYITYIGFGDMPMVMEAQYDCRNGWRVDGKYVKKKYVVGWYDVPKPEPMVVTKKAAKKRYPDFEVNEKGINKLIKAHLLPEDKMRELGFTDYRPGYWYFSKLIDRYETISFNLTINKSDAEDFNIMVLDENFCQPYDYQAMLSEESLTGPPAYAFEVDREVEKLMDIFQKENILSGHVRGEYI